MYPPEELDCYLMLGICDDASEKDIRDAYKKVALETHPDKQGGDGEAMKKVNEAYETLSDAARRFDYDTEYPTIKRKWKRYWAWRKKTDAGEMSEKKSRTNVGISKAKTYKKPAGAKRSKSKPKKPKPKKLKAKVGVVRRETMAEDIGPQFKIELEPGIEVSVAEHGRNCACCPRQRYKTKPEKAYEYDEEDDDEYDPDS